MPSRHIREAEVLPNPYSTSALEGVGSQYHAPAALPSEKRHLIYSIKKFGIIRNLFSKIQVG